MMGSCAPNTPLVPLPAQHGPLKDGWVRIAVEASGVCYADLGAAKAPKASEAEPVTPGHEIAGVITAVAEGVAGWRPGDRAAVGWFGGSCGHCAFCRSGDPVHCPERKIPGLSYPGGWTQSVQVPADALARIPDGMDMFDAAPMGCAGVTTFNAIRHAGVPVGATVAVFGVGGLGHLAVQFAHAMGYQTIAIARGSEREAAALELGAGLYIDSSATPPGAALAALGGADLIVNTAASSEAGTELMKGLRIRGHMVLIGVDGGRLDIPVAQMVMNGHKISGHLTGSALDTEETMAFAHAHGIRPVIEKMPLEAANDAVARLAGGKARFRIVLDPSAAR
ncbi:alcohol dehydrogenase [Arthrobacter sp. SW1]|nr:alcohol dehydrogenase [Arthrobacter sp. SW1]